MRSQTNRVNNSARFGAYLSLVERVVWDHEVGGSNPLAPILPVAACFTATFCSARKQDENISDLVEILKDRICRHNRGESKATKHERPWTLFRIEGFSTRREALTRERYYKTGRGRDELNKSL